ncbi:hypothetical protein FCM35_KLT08297 [Carex littledalei]|uniref:Uncharacterized protein n=1 Tax=Carex littledalei TaxID=544730 RepID=A0A833V6S9_9POAL|nr:hypothetical protein FCM35_KLT08297 [Carex littledalei]
MPNRKQKRKQKEKEKREKEKNNNTTNSSSSSTSSPSHLTNSNATSPSPPDPSSPKFNGNGRDEIIASEEEIAKRETEKENKKMEEEKHVEEREIEPDLEQVGPAVETEEEDKQITAKLGETSTESADLTSKGETEKEKEKEVEDEDAAGPAVEEDEEKEAEVSQVEIVEEIKESIAGPIGVVNTELVGPTCQGLEAVVEREVAELETGKVVEVTSPENPEEQAAEAHATSRDFPVTAAKRATWWDCCGLLDVFSGSSR